MSRLERERTKRKAGPGCEYQRYKWKSCPVTFILARFPGLFKLAVIRADTDVARSREFLTLNWPVRKKREDFRGQAGQRNGALRLSCTAI